MTSISLPMHKKHAEAVHEVHKNGKRKTLEWTASELKKNPTHTVKVDSAVASRFKKAMKDGTGAKMILTPERANMEGSGWGSMLANFGKSLLTGAAQGALQGAVNHFTGNQEGSGEVIKKMKMPPPVNKMAMKGKGKAKAPAAPKRKKMKGGDVGQDILNTIGGVANTALQFLPFLL
jgi:hypothetical protein